jgi:hypothetical protein
MLIRTTFIAAAFLITGANAQTPELHGRGGPGGPGARFLGAEAGMPGRVVKNAPYSADVVTESTQTLQDGSRIKQSSTVRVYRDSDGRTRREQSLQNLNGLAPNSNLPQVAFINDPVAGASYALDLANRTATRSGHNLGNWSMGVGRRGTGAPPEANGPRPQMRPRSNQNVKTEALGKQMIEGVQAEGKRTTMTIPAGAIGNEQPLQIVTESWYSPELDTVVLRKRSDPRSGETVTRYMNISRTEPSRILFEVPADFKIADNARSPRQKK